MICDICFDDKNEFILCRNSDKHQWCLDCYSSMIMAQSEKCPFCRTPLNPEQMFDFGHAPLDWMNPDENLLPPEMDDYLVPLSPPRLQRQNASIW